MPQDLPLDEERYTARDGAPLPCPIQSLNRSHQEVRHLSHLFQWSYFLGPPLPFSLLISTNVLDLPTPLVVTPCLRAGSLFSITRTLSMVSETWHLTNVCWISEEILQPWLAAEHSPSPSVLPRYVSLVRKILYLQGDREGHLQTGSDSCHALHDWTKEPVGEGWSHGILCLRTGRILAVRFWKLDEVRNNNFKVIKKSLLVRGEIMNKYFGQLIGLFREILGRAR